MTRRRSGHGSFFAAISTIALIAATAAAGLAASAANQDAIRQQLDRDRSVIDADMVSARAARTNGDQPAKFLGYCRTAVDAYNSDAAQAGNDLPSGYPAQLTSTDQCQLPGRTRP